MLKKIIVIVVTTFMLESVLVLGMSNPSAVYCRQLGYGWGIEETEWGEVGICKLPDGSTCRAWDLLKGKCGREYSYCKREGYELKSVSDSRCSYSRECAVCVLKDGREMEVVRLMMRDGKFPTPQATIKPPPTMMTTTTVRSRECGNRICEPQAGENYLTCPKDCHSGGRDGYCGKIKDGICDLDCLPEEDPDCVPSTTAPTPVTEKLWGIGY
ncbi:MAG: DUF333 domain-containing protein, partial [Candidatus Altiarchaeota archaeon]|nr:DUF333 domain-containing protein [Candidatus Altiarchaeota archaeon]